MPFFTTPPTTTGGNFGRNEYLRSTENRILESYTVAASTVPVETVDGDATQKILQSGEVLAKITSGADAGKVGPFQAGVTDGRQTAANIVGLNDSFEPWAFHEGNDKEVGVMQHGKAVQAWCTTRDAAGVRIALSDTLADAMRGSKLLDINFS